LTRSKPKMSMQEYALETKWQDSEPSHPEADISHKLPRDCLNSIVAYEEYAEGQAWLMLVDSEFLGEEILISSNSLRSSLDEITNIWSNVLYFEDELRELRYAKFTPTQLHAIHAYKRSFNYCHIDSVNTKWLRQNDTQT